MGIDVECTHVLVQRCLRRTYDDLLTKICYSDYSIVRGIIMIINFASQRTVIEMWIMMTLSTPTATTTTFTIIFLHLFLELIKLLFFFLNNFKAITVERKCLTLTI